MAKIRQIKRRIKSVESTRQITKTMEMVAAAKVKGAQSRIEAARPYAIKMMEVLNSVAQHVPPGSHPLLEVREPAAAAVIVPLTSNRGLCGAFNTNVVRRAEALYERERSKGVRAGFVVVGKKGRAALRFAGYPVEAEFVDVSDRPSIDEAREIAGKLVSMYLGRRTDKIFLVFNHFKSLLDQRTIDHLLLPVRQEEIEEAPARGIEVEHLFEPTSREVLARLLPSYIDTLVYRALLESAASEHAARRTAMKRATDNAGDMIEALTRVFNRARQAQITQEIAEIVGGAEALRLGR